MDKPKYLKTNRIEQIGIIVKDSDAAIEKFRNAFGWEPSAQNLRTPLNKGRKYKGEDEDFCVKMTIYKLDNITIELLEPLFGHSCWQDFADSRGVGIHHLMFHSASFDGTIEEMKERGYDLKQEAQSCRFKGIRWGYFDGMDDFGFDFEVVNEDEITEKIPIDEAGAE